MKLGLTEERFNTITEEEITALEHLYTLNIAIKVAKSFNELTNLEDLRKDYKIENQETYLRVRNSFNHMKRFYTDWYTDIYTLGHASKIDNLTR